MSAPKTKSKPKSKATPDGSSDGSWTELERRILATDLEGALDVLASMEPDERNAQRNSVRRLWKANEDARFPSTKKAPTIEWPAAATEKAAIAVNTAMFVTGLPEDAVDIRLYSVRDLEGCAQRFRPRILEGFAERLLASSPGYIRLVHPLIVSGLIERPRMEIHALGVIALARLARGKRELLALVDGDPELLTRRADGSSLLLDILDVEGTTEHSLASQDKYGGAWGDTFLALIERGSLERSAVIERVIGSLERDFPEFRAGWFSRFHESLAPSVPEMGEHSERYLGLLSSRVPATRKLALDAVARLHAEGVLDVDGVLAGLPSIFASETKAHVETGLKLLDNVVKRTPDRAHQAAALAAIALSHASADVQRKALARIHAFGPDDATRAAVRAASGRVAPSLRAELAAISGAASGAPESPTEPAASSTATPASAPMSPLHPSRRIARIVESVDLVECLGHLAQNPEDVDAFERCVDAVVRLAPFASEDVARLAKVPPSRGAIGVWSYAMALVELVTGIQGVPAKPSDDPIEERMNGLARLAALHRGLTPLATPTHRRGFLDPATLIDRLEAYEAAAAKPSRQEQALAIARLAPGGRPDLSTRASALPDSPFVRALRHALGDDVRVDRNEPLLLIAARVRHVGADDQAVIAVFGEGKPGEGRAASYRWDVVSRPPEFGFVHHDFHLELDEGKETRRRDESIRSHERPKVWSELILHEGAALLSPAYVAASHPCDLEAYFAEGARAIASNLDWWEARWESRAFLVTLLDATVPMTDMARLLLALGLAAKEPGEATTAVDALVAAVHESRLDPDSFGATMRRLYETPLVKVARWHKRLSDASSVDRDVAGVVFHVVACMLGSTVLDSVPKDTSALVELLVELQAAHGFPLRESSLTAIRDLPLPARGKRAAKSLR